MYEVDGYQNKVGTHLSGQVVSDAVPGVLPVFVSALQMLHRHQDSVL